jgi:predicted oxidoreductase
VLLDGTLDYLQRERLRPMAWSCLAGGRLINGDDERSEQCRMKLQAVGEELGGATIDQVALAWVLRLPCAPLPILGSGRLDRVATAAAAMGLKLSRDQWFGIWQAGRGIEVP